MELISLGKVYGEKGRIIAYEIQDQTGEISMVDSDELKFMIRNGEVTVRNLRLTSDNRLISLNGSGTRVIRM